MTLLSVVMPVYNQERYVLAAIESILQQMFADFEMIIVDDGSTDGTSDILKRISDPRVRVIGGSHGGFLVALDKAIRESRGRWVARMDSDDVCPPHRLQRQVEFLEAHPECVFAGTAYGFVTPNDKFIAPKVPFSWRYVKPEHITLGGRVFADPSTVFCRQTAMDVGLYDPLYEYENPLWYKLLRVGKGAVLGETLYYARWLLGSVSRSPAEKCQRIFRAVRQEYDPEHAKQLKPREPFEHVTATLKMARRSIDYYLLAGDNIAAREVAWDIWKKWPTELLANKLLVQSLFGIRAFRFWKNHKPTEYFRVENPC